MSQSDAAFRFVSWLRRGAATSIKPSEQGVRAQLPVTVTLNSGAQDASVTLELLGPGDVVAFDPRAVSRIWPPPNTADAEPNLFPLIELAQADLPWRYTPRAEDTSGRIRPWLALVVLTDAEIVRHESPTAERALAAVTIASGSPMPPADQVWAWSHVQVSGDDGTAIADVLESAPERCIARLLCPRRLDPDTHYTALLVPTFEVGRLAGLRKPVGSATSLGAAWATTAGVLTADLQLPVYYQWSFVTGDGGDFKSLVQQLAGRPLPATTGRRSLDASVPGGGLPAAADAPLLLGGALRSPATETPPPIAAGFTSALAKLLNLPADVRDAGGDPVVAPPLYGTWHAQRARLQPGQPPPWFETLNEHPELRAAAALGTAVVQNDRAALMESAWDQVAGIREANDRLRKAQLARAIGERLHARMVQPLSDETALHLAAPVHGRVKAATGSVATLVAASPARSALLSPAFRRLRRPLGPLGRRQGRADIVAAPVVTRVNDGTYASVLAAAPAMSSHLPTYSWLSSHVGAFKLPTAVEISSAPAKAIDIATGSVLHAAATDLGPAVPIGTPPAPPHDHPHRHPVDSPSMARFRSASIEFANRAATPAPGETLRRLDLAALRTTIVTAIDPARAIPDGLRARIAAMVSFPWAPPDPLTQVMAYPEYPQPMFAPLAALSPDWVLPGLGSISPNTVSLAKTNQPFIEAYMVGLNHELARELLWNDYPTDQRGSYFRQFWDTAGLVAQPTPETSKDITPMEAWAGTSVLGEHSPRPAPPSADGSFLVVVVRAEVLRRYPDTIVYAQRASIANGRYALAGDQLLPSFAARVAPDVAFFGFALTDSDARGDGTPANPGWFFVFQQHPSAPKFGLDVGAPTDLGTTPGSWEKLSWPQLVAAGGSLANLAYVDLSAAAPLTAALELPDGPAWHTLAAGPGKPFARGADHARITMRQPVRVGLHAAQMLI